MDKIALTIDNQDIVANRGTIILEAALRNGIYIPHLCYHPDLKPSGTCRLCLVEVDRGQLLPSCLLFVEEGMLARTRSTEVDKLRHSIVELLVADHHTDCRSCPKSGQ
jgi:formate dehydrogenase major subunit